ncbi:DUF2993 domain-containing protein [uncultured Corynebacterium sp.]|uniref:LmeA family phospholipid-binding protein n=1 Tax=uncultured Corynebacterium sp. TaxID=159447 RepID=UPI0025EE9EC8|nr:DUF2993 domain-containing protein [uncultured Corynebacterium sp.]
MKVKVLAAIACVVALAFGADAAVAAHVERALAAHAREADALPADPETYVGGLPFAQVALTGKVPRVSFQALDVHVDGVGIANTRTDIYGIDIDVDKAVRAEFAGAHAKRVEHTLSLDGVAFGQLLGMTDLDIANPYDISPTGGTASEAQLTGTVPGTDEKTSAVVTLRLDGTTFRMEPEQLIDVPSALTSAVTDAYTLELDTRDLPIGAQADLVEVAGGSIRFSSQQHDVTVTDELLSPVAVPAGR